MSTISGLSAAVSGLKAASTKVNVAANNVVNANTEGYHAQRVESSSVTVGSGGGGRGVLTRVWETADATDLAFEAVTLIQAENAYKASATVIGRVDDMYRQVLDVTA